MDALTIVEAAPRVRALKFEFAEHRKEEAQRELFVRRLHDLIGWTRYSVDDYRYDEDDAQAPVELYKVDDRGMPKTRSEPLRVDYGDVVVRTGEKVKVLSSAEFDDQYVVL